LTSKKLPHSGLSKYLSLKDGLLKLQTG